MEEQTKDGQYSMYCMDSGYASSAASVSEYSGLSCVEKIGNLAISNEESQFQDVAKFIPDLIELLRDEDPVVVDGAIGSVLQWSMEKSGVITNSSELMRAFVDCTAVLIDFGDITRIHPAANIFYNLSQERVGRAAILSSDGTVELVRLLGCKNDSVLNQALLALHNLILHQEGAKEACFAAKGLEGVVHLLHDQSNERILCIVADCLRLLAYKNPLIRLAILNMGGTSKLVQILGNSQFSELIRTVVRVLKVLSVCPQNAKEILACGGLQILASLINTSIDDIGCLWTIRNLSDDAVCLDNLDGLLRNLIQSLGLMVDKPVPEMTQIMFDTVLCITQILSNLTCNVRNKSTLRALNGVEILLRTINVFASMGNIVESAVCVLRHLTLGYPDAELAQLAILNLDGLPMLLTLLVANSWELRKAVVGIIRNLAGNSLVLPTIISLDVKQKLIDLWVEAEIKSEKLCYDNTALSILPHITQTIQFIDEGAQSMHIN